MKFYEILKKLLFNILQVKNMKMYVSKLFFLFFLLIVSLKLKILYVDYFWPLRALIFFFIRPLKEKKHENLCYRQSTFICSVMAL